MDATTKDGAPEISGHQRMIAAGVFVIIATVAILGNSLVILAITLSRRLQTTTNIYVFALSITDFLIVIIQVIQAVMLLVKSRSKFLLTVCSGAAVMNFFLLGSSVGALVLIAWNRMQIVTSKPSSPSKPTAKKAVASIIIVYSFIGLSLLGAGLIDGIEFGNFRGMCNYLGGNITDYTSGIYIFCMLVIIIVCYGRIYHYVRSHRRPVAQMNLRRFPNYPGSMQETGVDKHSSVMASTSLNVTMTGASQCTPIAETVSGSETMRIACRQRTVSTSVGILELPKTPCEQSGLPQPGELSRRSADDSSVTDQVLNLSPTNMTKEISLDKQCIPKNFFLASSGVGELSTTSGKAKTDTNTLVNINQGCTMLSSYVSAAERKIDIMNLNLQEDDLKQGANAVDSCIRVNPNSCKADDKTLGRSHRSTAALFLNRSKNLQTKASKCQDCHDVPSVVQREHPNRINTESRITFNMLLLVVTFFTCMTPTIIQLLIPGQQDSNWIIFLILFSNCCWNPLLYAWKHPDFKHTFGCIIRGKFSRIRDPVPWLRRRITSNG
nr:5-hydroxytryptamine receptor 1A-like [Lytechinus pictus]